MAKDAAVQRHEPEGESEEAIQPSALPIDHKQIIAARRASLYRGPIPPPNALARYEEILRGSADRILTMAENQQAHRQKLETTAINSDARKSMAGMVIGGVVVLAALAVAGLFVWQGQPAYGIAAVLAPIAALAGVFVYGTRSRSKERETRLEETLSPTPDSPEDPSEAPKLPAQ